jgi:DNA-binding MarR family transcriptional regulator
MRDRLRAEDQIAIALQASIGQLTHRLHPDKAAGELTLPEIAALVRLDRDGPATSGALARFDHVSAQSMGVTLAGLERRDLVERSPDPLDGRRILLSLTSAGLAMLRDHRSATTLHVASALAGEFSSTELEQLLAAATLLERLAQSI